MIIYHFRPYDMAYDYSVEVPDSPAIPPYFAFEAPPQKDGYYAIMRNGWVLVEGSLPPVPAPDPYAYRSDMNVTPFQAKAALYNAGLLDEVQAYVESPSTDQLVKIAWNNAIEYRRLSPMIESIGNALGMSAEELDNLFTAASQITA